MRQGAESFALGLERGEPVENIRWDPAGDEAVKDVVMLVCLRHPSF